MDDQFTLGRIEALVDEEHRLWSDSAAERLDEDGHRRLEEIRGELDELWKTLRRRRANPTAAASSEPIPFPPNELEGPEPEPPHLDHGVHDEGSQPDPDVPRDIP